MSNPVEVVQARQVNKPINWGKVGILISTLAMVIFVCAFGYGYFQLSQVTISLVRSMESLQAETLNAQNNLVVLQKAVSQLQAAQQAQAPTEQQEQMMKQLYARLMALDNQLDQLPLITMIQSKPDVVPTLPVATESSASWWRNALERSWQALSKIVIVRHVGQNTVAVTVPEEKTFLYQNLHAQMNTAVWGVLHQNDNIYQTSLTRMIAWIQQYFSQDAVQTINALQELQALQKINVSKAAQ